MESLRPGEKLAFGLGVESRALEVLLGASGVRLIARNFRARGGELDIVLEEERAEGPPELVIVEVRARRQGSWLGGIDAVEPRKLFRLRRATSVFLARYRGKARGARIDLMVWDGVSWSRFRNVDPG